MCSTLKQESQQESVPYFSTYSESHQSLNNLFEQTLEETSSTSNENVHVEANPELDANDDCEIIDDVSQLPLPLPSTSEGLTKREGDILSGNLAFTDAVSKFYLLCCDINNRFTKAII